MRYLPSFEALRSYVNVEATEDELMVTCSYEDFIKMLREALAAVDVDETWYLQTYKDIADAVQAKSVDSAKAHFISDGYFEGRWPFPITVDERYYLENNPGIADYVRRGMLKSGQQHFAENGYKEGRLPFGL